MNKMLIIDIDTIKAFMSASVGSLYRPQVEEIKPNLNRIINTAGIYGIKCLSLCDKHYGDHEHAAAEGELKSNGGPFELHAAVGTEEAEKTPETLLENDVIFIPTDLKINDQQLDHIVSTAKQIIVEKQSISAHYSNENLGGNPVLHRILDILIPTNTVDELRLDVFVVGVYTEYCITENVIPFLLDDRFRNVIVWIVRDGIAAFDKDGGEEALVELTKIGRGVRFTNTEQLLDHMHVKNCVDE